MTGVLGMQVVSAGRMSAMCRGRKIRLMFVLLVVHAALRPLSEGSAQAHSRLPGYLES